MFLGMVGGKRGVTDSSNKGASWRGLATTSGRLRGPISPSIMLGGTRREKVGSRWAEREAVRERKAAHPSLPLQSRLV